MTVRQQLVVGVFQDHTQAEQAIAELRQTGFDNQQIRFAGQGISTGGVVEKIKTVFTGQDMSAGGIYDDLVTMGAPPEDARFYQSELDAGRAIVLVVGTAVPLVAINILARYGAYGANQRFTRSSDYDNSTGVGAQEQVPDYDANQPADQSPDYRHTPANVQEHPIDDSNVEQRRADERFAQSPNYREVSPNIEDRPTEDPNLQRRTDQGSAQSPSYGEASPNVQERPVEDPNLQRPTDQRSAQSPNYREASPNAQERPAEDPNPEQRNSTM